MLRELAELTMLEEGDPQSFRMRAYESAAQAIAAQASDLGRLTAKELQKIDGIGKSTAEKIRELLETGKVAEARGAPRRSTRRAWSRCCASRGWGRRRVKRLRAELGVQSVDDLARVARRAQAARAARVSARSPRRSLPRSLARLEAQGSMERTPISVALPLAERIVARMREVPGVTHASSCGLAPALLRDGRRRRHRGRRRGRRRRSWRRSSR